MSFEKLMGAPGAHDHNPVRSISNALTPVLASRTVSDKSIGELTVAVESYQQPEQREMLKSTYSNIESQLRSVISNLNISVESHQIAAATMAAMMASNPVAALSAQHRPVPSNSIVMNIPVGDSVRGRVSLEAYDERQNRNAQLNSTIFNLLATSQDPLGELFFPTIVASPNEVGVTLAVRLFYVYNDFKRSTSGALANYGRKNVLRAYADTTILLNEMTQAVPVLRAGGADDNTARFVATSDKAPWSETMGGGISVTTNYLKVDQVHDILGLSQTNELLASGIMGPTDSLDAAIGLKKLLVKVTSGADSDVIEIDVSSIPSAMFTYSVQGNSQRMALALDSNAVVLGTTTRKVDTGAALDVLTTLANHNARIQLNVNGHAVMDKGDMLINRGSLQLVTLRDNSGNLVTGATFNDLAALLATASVIGFTSAQRRGNANLRQRGQLVDNQTEYMVIPIPYRSPLSVLAPTGAMAGDDNSAVQTLVALTKTRMSNEAVRTLVKTQTDLKSYKAVPDASGNLPELNMIGHHFVKVVYEEASIDLAATVDSRRSAEKGEDIRSAILEKIRFYANEMWRKSELKAALAILGGNTNAKPVVIVGCDIVLHNYLTKDGDPRSLGDNFELRVESTLATEFKDKIFISFGIFDESRNTAVNPLNSGNMLCSPEMVTQMGISRDGQMSNELIVTPRFVHSMNLPVLTVLTVTGLPSVTSKVALNMHSI